MASTKTMLLLAAFAALNASRAAALPAHEANHPGIAPRTGQEPNTGDRSAKEVEAGLPVSDRIAEDRGRPQVDAREKEQKDWEEVQARQQRLP